uniref:PHR domain-containing protein n=1 Tax=Acrobeloides nanus TaxID=290746 RepID=A0A914DK25_9BILA
DILIIRLKKAAQQLIGLISKELVLNKIKINKKLTLLQTPNRFRRTSSQINWDTGNGASDAIAFKVDIHGVSINGVGIYLGIQTVQYSYDLELLINTGDIANESWSVLEKGTGFLSGK